MNSTFCLFVTACECKTERHRAEHNARIATELASILNKPDMNGNYVEAEAHNSSVTFTVPKVMLERCATILSKEAFQLNASDGAHLLTKASVGQLAQVADLSLRLIEISASDVNRLLGSFDGCQLHTGDFLTMPQDGLKGKLCNFSVQGICLLQGMGIISEPLIQHDSHERRKVYSSITSRFFLPVSQIRSYLGDSVGLYFNWMQSSVLLLALLASFKFSTEIISWLFFTECFTPFHVLYGLFAIVWAQLALKIWRREKENVTFTWLEQSESEVISYCKHSSLYLRPEFAGEWRVSPVSSQLELYYPTNKRRIRYLITVTVTLFCLVIALLVNVLLLNLEGLIEQESSPRLYFAWFRSWSQEGEIFCPHSPGFAPYVPGILHPLLIFVMNQLIFRTIAERLTDFENHRTHEDYEAALVVKRFLFEAVDAYAALFYLGMVQVNWPALQSMLNTMFATDTIRRLTLECLLPFLTYRLRMGKDEGKAKKNDDQHKVRKELYGEGYEAFDDYLEMILQHGYLVLFATANPTFVPMIACLCTWIETYSDMFKILYILKRPIPRAFERGSDIWLKMLTIQAWCGILSNLSLLYVRNVIDFGQLFTLEHVFIAVALSIEFGISNEPVMVRDLRRFFALRKKKLLEKRISVM